MISGAGLSMAIPSAQSAVIGAVPMAAIGAASGTFNTVRQLGGAFGIAITTAVFTAQGGLGSAKAFSDGFGSAIATAAALAFAGAAIGLLLPRRVARTTGRAVPEAAARQASIR
jgi:hypothetical protein